MKKIFFKTLISLFIFGQSTGQTFTEIQINNAQGLYNGEVAWIDIDNDNDLDFVATGQSTVNDLHTIVYINNGDDKFERFTSLRGYSETGLELINSNNDEFIDLIINGRAVGSNNDLIIYLNDSSLFTPENLITDFLNSGSFGSIHSRDWNNDMQEDILITGINDYLNGNPIIETKLFTKDSANTYTVSSPIETGMYLSSVKFFDVDKDHDLDLIISGNDGEYPYQRTELYINENMTYVLSDNLLEPIQNTSIDIGDYNNDGYMDVIMTGYNEFLRDTTLLYKNVNGELIGVENTGLNDHLGKGGSVHWGDFDNDGDLDLLFNGESSGNWSFEIMINQGNDKFTHFEEENFENLTDGTARWGDYDRDGDLDIITTGFSEIDIPRLIVYRNDISTPNNPPSKPMGLTSSTSLENNSVIISWENSTDIETPQTALNYNLHIKDIEANVLLSSYADLSTGFLKRVWAGNIGNANSWKFENLSDGQYICYVQAIDGAFGSSPFSDSSVFYTGIPEDPGNLTLSTHEQGIQLTWEDNSNNEEFFIIDRSMTDETNYKPIDSVGFNQMSYIDVKLPPSFDAYYRIKSTNPNAESNYSNTSSISINGAPSQLMASSTANGIKLEWRDNSINEAYFIIERKREEDENFVKIDSVTSDVTEYIDTDDLINTISYRIYSKNNFGISEYSQQVQIIILNIAESTSQNIKLYPNPFNGSLFIDNIKVKVDPNHIEVFNIKGKNIPFVVWNREQNRIELKIEDYSSKCLFICIQLKDQIRSFRVMRNE